MANFHRIFKMGENIKEKVSKSPTNVELVHKRAYKPGTFFWLPNRFHLTQCAFPATLFQRVNFQQGKFSSPGNLRECPTVFRDPLMISQCHYWPIVSQQCTYVLGIRSSSQHPCVAKWRSNRDSLQVVTDLFSQPWQHVYHFSPFPNVLQYTHLVMSI